MKPLSRNMHYTLIRLTSAPNFTLPYHETAERMPIRIRRPVKDPVIIRGRRIYNLALYSAYSILKRMQKLGYVVRSKNDLYITEYGSNVLINHEMNNLDKE